MRSVITDNEARHYWRLAQNVAVTRAAGAPPDEMTEWIDELEVLREMTDWPLLKERCTRLIASVTIGQQIA